MANGNVNPWILLLIGAGLLVIASQHKDNNELRNLLALEQQQRRKAEESYLTLLNEFMKRVNDLPEDVKSQLWDIYNHYKGIDENVGAELKTVLELIDADKQPIAIEKLVKVIENILKEKFVTEKIAPAKEKCPTLFKMIEQAFGFKWITKREYRFIELIREPRNEEAHHLNVSFSRNEAMIYILAGIEILHTFKGIKRTT